MRSNINPELPVFLTYLPVSVLIDFFSVADEKYFFARNHKMRILILTKHKVLYFISNARMTMKDADQLIMIVIS